MKDSLLLSLNTLVPDLLEVAQKRYHLLSEIQKCAPIGRRVLADRLSWSERTLRTEIEFLKKEQLIQVSREGMSLTSEGVHLLDELQNLLKEEVSMSEQEQLLAQQLGIQRVVIVPGNGSEDVKVYEQFGPVLTEQLHRTLRKKENIVAVLGGSTLRSTAEFMQAIPSHYPLCFVSGRGALGNETEWQANVICERMAQKVGGSYLPLYVPESIRKETCQSLQKEPSIQRILKLLQQADCVIHGIGDAISMASLREMDENEINFLKKEKAVAESFGCFYNARGEVIYQLPRLGLLREDLNHIPFIYAVAGGVKKAEAICGYMKQAPKQTCLITDQSAADRIQQLN